MSVYICMYVHNNFSSLANLEMFGVLKIFFAGILQNARALILNSMLLNHFGKEHNTTYLICISKLVIDTNIYTYI